MTPQAQAAKDAFLRRRLLGSSIRRSSAVYPTHDVENVRYVVVVVDPINPDPPRASSFGGTQSNAWVEKLYAFTAASQHDEAVELLYDRLEELLELDPDKVDMLLEMLDVDQLGPEEVVAALIATLAAKDKLPSRPAFVARGRRVLADEPEGVDEVLRGLV